MSMSTNIDDIPDPNANQQHPDNSHMVSENVPQDKVLDNTYIQKHDLNSNIKSDISMYKEHKEHKERRMRFKTFLLVSVATNCVALACVIFYHSV